MEPCPAFDAGQGLLYWRENEYINGNLVLWQQKTKLHDRNALLREMKIPFKGQNRVLKRVALSLNRFK